jgi:hypothetical protein
VCVWSGCVVWVCGLGVWCINSKVITVVTSLALCCVQLGALAITSTSLHQGRASRGSLVHPSAGFGSMTMWWSLRAMVAVLVEWMRMCAG